MGIALKEQGKLDEAIEAYRRTLHRQIMLKPIITGVALLDQGKLEEATEAFKASQSNLIMLRHIVN